MTRLVAAAAALLAGAAAPSGAAAALPPSLDIAYSFAGGIHLMRTDGSGVVRLTSPSPGGLRRRRRPARLVAGRLAARFVRTVEGWELVRVEHLRHRRGGRASCHDAQPTPCSTRRGRPTVASSPSLATATWVRATGPRSWWLRSTAARAGARPSARRRPFDQRRATGVVAGRHAIAYTRTRLDREYDFRTCLFSVGRGRRQPTAPRPRCGRCDLVSRRHPPRGLERARSQREVVRLRRLPLQRRAVCDERRRQRAGSAHPKPRRRLLAVVVAERPAHRLLERSQRPRPGSDTTREIYAIRPDGSCLTWLTNGAPSSSHAAWRPAPTALAQPPCGPTPRRPRTEVVPDGVRAGRGDPGVWLGERHRRPARQLLRGIRGPALESRLLLPLRRLRALPRSRLSAWPAAAGPLGLLAAVAAVRLRSPRLRTARAGLRAASACSTSTSAWAGRA